MSGCWSISEDTWVRHARSSRYCQFVLNEKGAEFVATAVEEHGLWSENHRDEERIRVRCHLKNFYGLSASSNGWSSDILKPTIYSPHANYEQFYHFGAWCHIVFFNS